METKRQTEGVSKKMISSSLRLSRCYVDATTCTDDSTSSCSSSSKIDSWRHNIGTRHQPQCWNGYCLLVRQPARKKLPYFLMLDILPSSDLCKHLESGFSACFVDRTNRKLFSPHLSSILFDGCCFLLLIFFIFFFFRSTVLKTLIVVDLISWRKSFVCFWFFSNCPLFSNCWYDGSDSVLSPFFVSAMFRFDQTHDDDDDDDVARFYCKYLL